MATCWSTCLLLLSLLLPRLSSGSVCHDLERTLNERDSKTSAVVRRVDQMEGLDTDSCLNANASYYDPPPCASLLYALHGASSSQVTDL